MVVTFGQLKLFFMRITSSICFYCRQSKAGKNGLAPIEVSVIVNGKRVFINLPRKEYPDVFKRETNSRKNNGIKEYLEEIRTRLNEYQLELLQNNMAVTATNLKECFKTGGIQSYRIKDLFEDYLKILRNRVGVDLTDAAYRKYELTKELFFDYINPEKEVTEITPALILAYYGHLQKKYSATSSSASYIAKTKTFVQFGIDNNKIKVNPFQGLKVKREKKQIDYLTEEEINKLKNAEIENESLDAVRNAFLLQVYSGLSYIDLEHLKKEDIKIMENGTHYIQKPRVKTGVVYTSVILPDGIEILKKNNYQMKVISNQKMNTYLKQVMVFAGINHKLVTHLGRKTYGHILLNSGVRMEVVAKMLGHSSSKTTAKYYAEVTPETVIKEVEKII